MKTTSLYYFLIISLLAVYCPPSNGYHIAASSLDLSDKQNLEPIRRQRRQVEDFEDEYGSTANQEAQEEPGFWDRVVKVALKLFSRFVEWLNS